MKGGEGLSYRARKKLRPDKSQCMGRCAVWSPAAECRLFFLLRRWPHPPHSSSSFRPDIRIQNAPSWRLSQQRQGKSISRIFFKLGAQRSSVISFCSPTLQQMCCSLYTLRKGHCALMPPTAHLNFIMSSVSDLKIIPIREFKSALFVKKMSDGLVVAWPSLYQPRCQ